MTRARREPRRLCPVPMCANTARAGHLMCRDCWSAVPKPERTEVNRAWRAVKAALGRHSPLLRSLVNVYRAATADAVSAVQRSRP